MSDDGQQRGDTSRAAGPPLGIWVSVAANVLGLCAGAVFLFAEPGGRARGTEPEARAFVVLGLLAAALGLFAGLPVSLFDLFCQRHRLWGSVGTLLALTPGVVAHLVSELVAAHKGILFD
jgi:hypothetical protein